MLGDHVWKVFRRCIQQSRGSRPCLSHLESTTLYTRGRGLRSNAREGPGPSDRAVATRAEESRLPRALRLHSKDVGKMTGRKVRPCRTESKTHFALHEWAVVVSSVVSSNFIALLLCNIAEPSGVLCRRSRIRFSVNGLCLLLFALTVLRIEVFPRSRK